MVSTDSIVIRNPKKLKTETINAERIPIGLPGDYKPCIAMLPDGELLLVAFFCDSAGKENGYREDIIMFRSKDGGRTWSQREITEITGREPYFSILKDGTIFVTTHLLKNDIRNKEGYCYSYIYRSVDGGCSWEETAIRSEDNEEEPKSWTLTTRNVLELNDGSLIFGVSGMKNNFTWISNDKGKRWKKNRCGIEMIPAGYPFPAQAETFLWQTPKGRVIALYRVDNKYFAFKRKPLEGGLIDHFESMVIYETKDKGVSWEFIDVIGAYGQMYPHLMKLKDGRILLTYTQRAMDPELGVRAVIVDEDGAGVCFDFENDVLVIDRKTPGGMLSGGGFGPTVQTGDGTLLTSYSYRGADDNFHMEVARWELPEL